MPEMAVSVGRSHLGADHAVCGVHKFVYVRRFDRPGEAGPAAPGFKFVRRDEERLAGHDIDVDAGFFIVEVFSGARRLGSVSLCYAILLWRKVSNHLLVLAEYSHLTLL